MDITGKQSFVSVAVVMLTIMVKQSDQLSFPVLYTQGTHYEVGYDIGSTFKDEISTYIMQEKYLMSVYYPWSKTTEGRKVIDGFLSTGKKAFPQFVDELRGIADGSNVSFTKVFLMNLRSELSALLLGNLKTPDACSDILVNRPKDGCVIIAHNEDNEPLVRKLGFFVVAKIYNNSTAGKGKFVSEQFTAFSYPGELPGNAFGFNSNKLTITVNALYPKTVNINKLARSFLTRALLSFKTVEDVKSLLTNSVGSAYGFSVNIAEYSQAVTNIWNLEVAPSNNSASNIDLYQVTSETDRSGQQNGGNYFHVNMYRRIKIGERPKNVISSQHRTKRIEEMGTPRSVIDTLRILGDEEDKLYPIYRTPRPTDDESTAATGVFDFQKGTLDVYKDNPKSSAGPVLTFKL